MTDRPTTPAVATAGALTRLADEILPALIARLDGSDLGELEVRHDGWRVRLRRSVTSPTVAPASSVAPAPTGATAEAARAGATSPTVGYFVPSTRTPVGHKVAAGDVVGWVEVLGVRQEVVSPRDGVVGRLLAEAGQAVEYGQELVVVDGPRRAVDHASDAPGPTGPAGDPGRADGPATQAAAATVPAADPAMPAVEATTPATPPAAVVD